MLDKLKEDPERPVVDYAFMSGSLSSSLQLYEGVEGHYDHVALYTAAQFKGSSIGLVTVPQNFFDVVDNDYIQITEMHSRAKVDKLPNGQHNAVEALYYEIPSDFNPNNTDRDPENIQVGDTEVDPVYNYTGTIKLIIPEGLRDYMAISTEEPAKICLRYHWNYMYNDECTFTHHASVRAMASKIPALYFSAYR